MISKGMLEKEAMEKWNANPVKCFLKDGYYKCHLLTKRELYESIMLEPVGFCQWNEVILPGRPCKLVVDIEHKVITDETNGQAQEEELSKIQRDISEKYLADYHEVLESPIVLEATRLPDVFSIHLVYPSTWFASPGDILRFIYPVTLHYPPGRIDRGIYSDTSVKQLRLPYCSKREDPTRVLLPRDGPRKFDWDFFLKCCVSVTIQAPPTEEKQAVNASGIPMPSPPSSLSGRDTGTSDMPEEVSRVIRYLRICYGPFTVSGLKVNGIEWQCYVRPGLFCPHKYETEGDGFHQSKKPMYIGSKDGKRVYVMCPDDACSKQAYLAENMEHLMKKKKHPT
jgi:hypothetical protein